MDTVALFRENARVLGIVLDAINQPLRQLIECEAKRKYGSHWFECINTKMHSVNARFHFQSIDDMDTAELLSIVRQQVCG
jgi:bacterioferritin (cytochrome b1)